MKLGKIMIVAVLALTLFRLAVPIRAQDEAKKKPSASSKTADAAASAEKLAREALARFDREWRVADRPGTWKVRMECLMSFDNQIR